ncbi:MAG: PQQ-binding-like beta-propeller repeat protein [Vicinamibacteria bacterium]|nr:PQQ-binding-like beta-propeller repeat protein [Vicinamibacteria bacterium]
MRALWVVPFCFTLVAGAQEWPRFRGPHGAGVAEGAALPVLFGPTKNLVWRVEVPAGKSSPIVGGDRIFLTALDGDRLATLAFDLKTGAPAWRRDLARTHAHEVFVGNDSATPTPATDGESLFVFFPDFGLVAFDLDGKERWRLPLGPFDSFYGLSASPVVHGDTVALVCDQRKGSFALAVDKRSGQVRWRVARPNAVTEAYATPVVYTPASGAPQLLVAGARRNDSYDLGTGRNLWWVGKQGISPAGSPVVFGDTLISVATGGETPEYPPFDEPLGRLDTDKDGHLSRDEAASDAEGRDHFGWMDADGDGRVTRAEWDARRDESVAEAGVVATAIGGEGDRTASNLRWRYKKSFSYLITPLVYRDTLYLVKGGGIVTTLDPRTGAVLKTGRTPEAIGSYYASPVAGDGKVYLLSEAGQVTVLKADPQWEILAVNALAEKAEATPAIAGGRLYIRTEKALYSFGGPEVVAAR